MSPRRVLELKQRSSITGETRVSRMVIVLPSTQYEGYLTQGWADVTEQLTDDEIMSIPMRSLFDGA